MSNQECTFCKIINKEIPTEFVYEDEEISVFADINPKADVHLLVVPRDHIKSLLDVQDNQYQVLTKMIKVVQRLVEKQKLQGGYQVLINGGHYQHIPHIHLHLLGERG